MIRVENLTCYYGERAAVDDISFNIEQGEIVGFLGPNGAGKSSTMKMITGYMMPTRGNAWVAGHDMTREPLEGRSKLGYLPETVPLYDDMTTNSYLHYIGRLRGLDKAKTALRVDEVIEICALGEYRDVLLSKLSKGYRQRVGLGQSIINDPEVLILDEPTIGIDPIQVAQTRQLIKHLGENRTILLSSHILPEVSMVCERVIIINKGKIAAEGSIDNLSSDLMDGEQLKVRVRGGSEAEVAQELNAIKGVCDVRYQDPFHLIRANPGHELQGAIIAAVGAKSWSLLSMESVGQSLEDIFLHLTTSEGGSDRETDT